MLKVTNPSSRLRTATYSAILKTGYANPSRSEVIWPGGAKTAVTVTAKGTRVTREIDFPPGTSTIRFSTNAPPARDAPGDTRVVNLNFSDASLVVPSAAAFLGPGAGPFGALSVLGPNGLES